MLEVKNITKSYTTGNFTQQALKDLTLKFRKNEFVAVLGPSGSGKTTLLNIIGGLDRYDQGDLIINGKSTKKFKDSDWDAYRNNCIGFVFQSYNLISHISVLDNIEMGMTLSGMNAEKRRKKALEVLERVDLTEHAHKKPSQLSGGQMQRVAIARALANDPDVILADEPTGALDSKTSVQIMELIKEIAKDKLVIMVTHNGELANTYANRIIKFKDGMLIEDSNPIKKQEKIDNVYNIRKTAMSFLTALKLSLNNIFTKKGRTLITAFASSIGIIGIALILSLSNGFDIQIDKFEVETLSSMPIMINREAMNITEDLMINIQSEQKIGEKDYTDEQYVYPNKSIIDEIRRSNEFTDDYLDYLDKIDKTNLSGISYTRAVALNLLANVDGKKVIVPTRSSGAPMQSSFSVLPEKAHENNPSFAEKNYDILKGKLPSEKDELLLLIDSKNRVNKEMISYLGLDPNSEKIEFDKVIGREFKVILNNEFYTNTGSFYLPNNDFEKLYNSDKALTIKIVGIARGKEGNQLFQNMSSIAYTEKLVDYVLEQNKDSDIVKKQKDANYSVLNGDRFDLTTKEGITAKENVIAYLGGVSTPYAISIYPKDFDSKEKITDYLDKYNEDEVSKVEDTVKSYLDKLIPLIKDEKDNRLKTVDSTLQEVVPDKVELAYMEEELTGIIERDNVQFVIERNEIVRSTGGVTYTDLAATMVALSGSIMDAVTIVLVAFSAISLIVSSIMIGIITYISVLERTKEIGILRALGARKKDISRVFNAETFIIGITSGILGIVIARLLIIPANMLLYNLTDLEGVAQLNPLHALILIIISITLTLIGGALPANIASKKDPVEALRTE